MASMPGVPWPVRKGYEGDPSPLRPEGGFRKPMKETPTGRRAIGSIHMVAPDFQ